MKYHIAHTIGGFEPARWDAVAGTDLGMCHRWQRVMEASTRDHRPLYFMLEDGKGPLAAAVLNRADRFGRRGWREALLRRLTLVVGAPFSARACGIAVRSGVTLQEVVSDLERGFDAICGRERRPLLGIGNVADADLPMWRTQGYAMAPQPPNMVLELPLDASYDSYLERLAKKDRAELRRVRRRGEELGVTVTVASPGAYGDRLYPLLCEVFARHGTAAAAVPFTPALFASLEREMPGEAMVFLGHVKGQLAGFFLCLKHGDTLMWPAAGLRYELAHPSYLYFVLIDEAVRWAVAHGYRRVHGGMTNEAQKARHGFRPHARWFCYRASPRPLNRALAIVRRPAQRLIGASVGFRSGSSHHGPPEHGVAETAWHDRTSRPAGAGAPVPGREAVGAPG